MAMLPVLSSSPYATLCIEHWYNVMCNGVMETLESIQGEPI